MSHVICMEEKNLEHKLEVYHSVRQINRWSMCINRLWRKCIRAWRKRTLQDRPRRQPLPRGERVIINIILQRRSSRASDLCRPLSVRVRYKMHDWTEAKARGIEGCPPLLRASTRPMPRRVLSTHRFVIPSRSQFFELMDVPTPQFCNIRFKWLPLKRVPFATSRCAELSRIYYWPCRQ